MTLPSENAEGAGGVWNPLADLELLSGEMFDRWDSDQRAGKILTALSGHAPGYKAQVDSVRLACAVAPDLVEALTETWRVLRAAGTLNLSNGVQLGQISWYAKICDAEALSNAALAKAGAA